MELRHLKLIKAVAEVGSLTAAGKDLYLSQPALSRQLHSIQDELGVTLFQRIGKRMKLTQAGEILYNGACRILCELKKTENDINAITEGRGGELRIATACYTCYHWLPHLLGIYRKQYPKVEIKINLGATADPVGSLLTGELDVGLVNRIVPAPELHYENLFEDEDIVIVHKDHHWATREYIRPGDLANENLIVFDSELKESNLFKKILTPAGVVPKQVVKLPMTEAILNMIKAGLGISVMVRWAAAPYLKSFKLVPLRLTKKGVKRIWYAVTLKDRVRPHYIQAFINLIKSEAGFSRA